MNEIREARSRVVQGQPLAGKDEETLLYAPYLADLMMTDKERWAKLDAELEKKNDGGDDGTV